MQIYVGTSGWMYDWNPKQNFEWYVKNSGLNAVELNASFYRFPFPNQVVSWARKGRGIRWAVKVHRSITHMKRLSESALDIWRKFYELFKPLDPYVDFYLFQLPPTFTKNDRNIERLVTFAKSIGLGVRMAVEFRDTSWFSEDTVDLCRRLGITVVSIDSPIGTWIVMSSDAVYLRMHGRGIWYAYEYSDDELLEVAKLVIKLKPSRVYVFFNNDHWMLRNAHTMKRILEDLARDFI